MSTNKVGIVFKTGPAPTMYIKSAVCRAKWSWLNSVVSIPLSTVRINPSHEAFSRRSFIKIHQHSCIRGERLSPKLHTGFHSLLDYNAVDHHTVNELCSCLVISLLVTIVTDESPEIVQGVAL